MSGIGVAAAETIGRWELAVPPPVEARRTALSNNDPERSVFIGAGERVSRSCAGVDVGGPEEWDPRPVKLAGQVAAIAYGAHGLVEGPSCLTGVECPG